jgi:hypothetical protein
MEQQKKIIIIRKKTHNKNKNKTKTKTKTEQKQKLKQKQKQKQQQWWQRHRLYACRQLHPCCRRYCLCISRGSSGGSMGVVLAAAAAEW